ncbi:polysaccharide pyruvyl transferase family protein [Streptomyces sp. NPDC001709]
MRILVIHARSNARSGGELLVAESVGLLRRLGVPEDAIHVVAAGPRSGSVRRLIAGADAVVAVGGGYLRARTWREGLVTVLAHGRHLRAAAHGDATVLYLPQSVGPLGGPAGALLRRWLRRLPQVAVRDDRSVDDVPQAMRVPDLGLQHLARQAPSVRRGDGSVTLVAHRLPTPGQYAYRLRAFAEDMRASGIRLRTSLPSGTDATGDEHGFASRIGLEEPSRTLDARLASAAGPSLVVSTVLRDCVHALSAGVPTIHLSDEPAGPAAFSDLGLTEFVHPARSFSPEVLAIQCRRILRGPDGYWDRLSAALPLLAERATAYEEHVAQALGPALRGQRRQLATGRPWA